MQFLYWFETTTQRFYLYPSEWKANPGRGILGPHVVSCAVTNKKLKRDRQKFRAGANVRFDIAHRASSNQP